MLLEIQKRKKGLYLGMHNIYWYHISYELLDIMKVYQYWAILDFSCAGSFQNPTFFTFTFYHPSLKTNLKIIANLKVISSFHIHYNVVMPICYFTLLHLKQLTLAFLFFIYLDKLV